MKILFKLALSLLIIYVLSACAGGKNIDFNTAYKFSTYNYQKTIELDRVEGKDTLNENSITASSNPEIVGNSDNNLAKIETKIYGKIGVSSKEGNAMEIDELKLRFKQLSLKEKREIRKDIKTELKQLNFEVNNAHSTMDVNHVNELSELTRWSIIIGSVGLVVLILGAIFSAGILTFFGALFVVGAAVLFILDQV